MLVQDDALLASVLLRAAASGELYSRSTLDSEYKLIK